MLKSESSAGDESGDGIDSSQWLRERVPDPKPGNTECSFPYSLDPFSPVDDLGEKFRGSEQLFVRSISIKDKRQ